MAFDIIEMLLLGKSEYLNYLTLYDIERIKECVRNSEFKKQIIEKNEKDFDIYPFFGFLLFMM